MKSPLASGGLARREAPAETYNRQFSENEQSNRHFSRSIHFPLYREVCRRLKTPTHARILEVGCGTGAFAHCVMETLTVTYRGFDFSSVAVQKARERTGRDDCFFIGDARNAESYDRPYDAIACLEVLEHIERDLDVIANWKSGCKCVCSVPNFDYETHVRWFQNEDEIISRYGRQISIRQIKRIACPLVRGRGWRAYLRQLRWSRDNPQRFLALLGYKTSDHFSGWFVFCGVRR
jgi:2-polyprenyl-3-methyl-5-hydroxy-6-metoxy-1,4-benzoquinol methylase